MAEQTGTLRISLNKYRLSAFPLTISASRYLLFYLAIVVLLLATSLGGIGFAIDSGPFLLAGTGIWIIWFGLMFAVAIPRSKGIFDNDIFRVKQALLSIFIILAILGIAEMVCFYLVIPGYTAKHPGTSLGQTLTAMQDSFRYNDSTALCQQAADNLLQGKNPYSNSNVVQAIQKYHGSFDRFTPLRVGSFVDTFPYPTLQQFQQVYNSAVQNGDQVPPEFVNGVCYPAGEFLLITPFVAMGIHDIRIVYLSFTLLGIAYAAWQIRGTRRVLFIGAALISVELWNIIGVGETGSVIFPLLMVTWLALIKKQYWLSAVFMGIAIATKQNAWFFLPFYLILLWRQADSKTLMRSAGVIAGMFFATNVYFIIQDPLLWVKSILTPMTQPMFPVGGGLVTLTTSGLLHINSSLPFVILEGIAFIGCILWYFFKAKKYPHTAPVLSVLPLFFAWRSVWNYFFYVDLIMLAGILIEEPEEKLKTENLKVKTTT